MREAIADFDAVRGKLAAEQAAEPAASVLSATTKEVRTSIRGRLWEVSACDDQHSRSISSKNKAEG